MTIRHLLDIDTLASTDIERLISSARFYKNAIATKTVNRDRLAGKIILTVFYENSTRTKVSFEIAAKRLGADVINWDINTSAVKKGETFGDTIGYLNAFEPDALIIRHHEHSAAQYVAGRSACPVINGGDGWNQHPSQALLDAFTLMEHKGRLEGLTIAICGDVAHSRVANSNLALMTKMGAKVRIIAPKLLQPQKIKYDNVSVFDTMEEGLKGCDAVMMLRLQKERMEQAAIPNDSAYFNSFGLTPDRLALAKPDVLVMHPGPMNRGIEIAGDVADDPNRSIIFKQGANGIPMRMAILDWAIPR